MMANQHDKSLEKEHEEVLQFLYACPIGLAEVAGDGAIGLMNPLAMKLLLPIARTPFITNFFTLMDSYAPELRNMIDAFPAPNGVVCENHRIFVGPGTDKGSDEPKVLACTLVKLGGNRFTATIADVSGLVAQERRLKEAETWFASLLDNVNDFAIISLDAEGRIDAVNPSVLRQTGFAEHEIIGQTLDMFRARDAGPAASSTSEQIATAHRNGWYLEEGWHARRDGGRYWCQTLIAARGEGEGHAGTMILGYTVVLRHVTWQATNAGNLRQMLTTDHLTGACNRARFFEVAEREYARSTRHGQPLSLIMIDVDHFKQVNDSYGHGAGDEALKALSRTCMSMLRPSDTFARLGGEEFAVLLPSTELHGAGDLAERLRVSIATTPIRVARQLLHCTASLGCAILNAECSTLSDLLAAADTALYAAKGSGRNRVMLSSPVRSVA
ncbi:diguanylate cyclase [Rhodopila sp.]|uniref:GGDEF domain-containing protein n=1 Tax=Rhodopila sp. TaxID=2480087 RepID=UPI003D10644D